MPKAETPYTFLPFSGKRFGLLQRWTFGAEVQRAEVQALEAAVAQCLEERGVRLHPELRAIPRLSDPRGRGGS